jgi:hypothetical protein
VRVAVVAPTHIRSNPHLQQLVQGISACGDQPLVVAQGERPPPGIQAVACWGWRRGEQFHAKGHPVLVVERGYVGDRFHWTSLGWNGLNGKAVRPDGRLLFPKACGIRWAHHFAGGYLQSWQDNTKGYALVLGQVPSDMSVKNVNLRSFYARTVAQLKALGHEVRFRPHPKAQHFFPRNVTVTDCTSSLEDDLNDAKFAVTWNSNSAVDAVLAGVPCVTFDQGSMAWGVTSHSLEEPVTMPSRDDWVSWLAWQQWAPEELANGYAWQTLRGLKP